MVTDLFRRADSPENRSGGLTPVMIWKRLKSRPWEGAVPALLIVGAAVGYALFSPQKWEVSQGLIVRNDAALSQGAPGKFDHAEQLKEVQETILEILRSRSVLRAALEEVGPPPAYNRTSWPDERAIRDLRRQVKLLPPKGADFGSTEIFYVSVRDSYRDRAIRLLDAVCRQLESRHQQLRDQQGQSMVEEMQKAVQLAESQLSTAIEELHEIENQVAEDLGELRSLQQWSAGETSLRRLAADTQAEIHRLRTKHEEIQNLLRWLDGNGTRAPEPGAIPAALLDYYSPLRRFREGLAEAQLRRAELLGHMSAEHPAVRVALEAEQSIETQLSTELERASAALAAEKGLIQKKLTTLEKELSAIQSRLARLATLRTQYDHQLQEVATRSELLRRAEQKLAEARIAQATARATSVIARVDEPEIPIDPAGPDSLSILFGGTLLGLLTGLGIVLWNVQSTGGPAPAETEDSSERRDGVEFPELSGRSNLRAVASNGRTISIPEAADGKHLATPDTGTADPKPVAIASADPLPTGPTTIAGGLWFERAYAKANDGNRNRKGN